jgi:quercetin dioxygenase-like cupin family protein
MNELAAGTVLDLKALIRIHPGRITSRKLLPPLSPSALSADQEWELFALDSGETISSETIPQGQFIHVLKGELCMVAAGEQCRLTAGESIFVAAGTWHEYAAESGCIFLKIRY